MSGVIAAASAGIRFGGTTTSGTPATAAIPAGVGEANRALTLTETPRARSRSTSDTASSECPPSSKKLSSTPTRSRPSTSANTEHRISSTTVDGARPSAATRCSPGPAEPCDPACRSPSAAAHPAPPPPRGPCTPASARQPRPSPQEGRSVAAASLAVRGNNVGDQALVARGVLADQDSSLRHRRVVQRPRPRSHRARSGSRGSSPARRHGRRTPTRRQTSSAPHPRCGTSATPPRTGTPRTAPPSAPAGQDSPAPAADQRRTSPRPRLTGTGRSRLSSTIHPESGDGPTDQAPKKTGVAGPGPVGHVHRGLGEPVDVHQRARGCRAPPARNRAGSNASPPNTTARTSAQPGAHPPRHPPAENADGVG